MSFLHSFFNPAEQFERVWQERIIPISLKRGLLIFTHCQQDGATLTTFPVQIAPFTFC